MGAVFEGRQTEGLFTASESDLHINVLELRAVYFGLQALCYKLVDIHIRLLIDNTTAVSTINNMGSCRSIQCDNEVKNIWEWTINRNNWITAAHIPGKLNIEADLESRKNETKTEWKLNVSDFTHTTETFAFMPEVDLFASRTNTQLPNYMSYRPDPYASVVDSFTVNWKNIKFYAFPPFSCINRVIQKVVEDEATGLIIAPDWPNQIWYPSLLKICVHEPIVLPYRKDLLHLPNQPEQIHQIWDRLPLLACLVSGKH